MKIAVLFTLFTWASAIPLDWSTIENFNNQQPIPTSRNQWQLTNLSPAQQASFEINHKIKLAEVENAKRQQTHHRNMFDVTGTTLEDHILAQQVAQEVVKDAVQGRQGQTVESIVDIQKQLQQNVLGVPQQLEHDVAAKTINGMEKELQMLQLAKEKFLPASQLSQSLEAAIEAQLISDNVETEMERLGKSLGVVKQPSAVFRSRVEQLIDQTNIQEMKIEIMNQQSIIKMLQQQQHFISQQLEVVQSELVAAQKQGTSVAQLQQLQQAQDTLRHQEKQVVVKILARQQAIQQLGQALAEQQLNLQQNIKAEQVQQSQRWSGDAAPWTQRVGETFPTWKSYGTHENFFSEVGVRAPLSTFTFGNQRPQVNWID